MIPMQAEQHSSTSVSCQLYDKINNYEYYQIIWPAWTSFYWRRTVVTFNQEDLCSFSYTIREIQDWQWRGASGGNFTNKY